MVSCWLEWPFKISTTTCHWDPPIDGKLVHYKLPSLNICMEYICLYESKSSDCYNRDIPWRKMVARYENSILHSYDWISPSVSPWPVNSHQTLHELYPRRHSPVVSTFIRFLMDDSQHTIIIPFNSFAK